MSFVTNVNTLAAYFQTLDRLSHLFDEETIAILKTADLTILKTLADDLRKGTSNGLRKIDIELVENAKDPLVEVAYDAVEIKLNTGHSFTTALSFSTLTDTTGTPVTSSKSYAALRDELNRVMNLNNSTYAGDPTKEIVNTYIDIIGETVAHPTYRCLRVLDVLTGVSNIVSIRLYAASGSEDDAINKAPEYSWADTTSALQVLIDHLPEFVDHTKIWQQVNAKNPLPTSGTGYLGKDSVGVIKWQAGDFVIDLGMLNITQDIATNGIDKTREWPGVVNTTKRLGINARITHYGPAL